MEFDVELKNSRIDARLTQEELAALAGLSVRTVRDIERGRVRYPRPETVRLLGAALGLNGAALAEFGLRARSSYWTERVQHDEVPDTTQPAPTRCSRCGRLRPGG